MRADWNAMDDEAFRAIARKFLETHYPPALRHLAHRPRWKTIRGWYLTLAREGWLAPNWPVEHGGMGLEPAKQLVWVEEQEAYGAARVPDHGITMIGPTLIRLGTDEQRRTYLPKILTGEHIWGQAYSEPDAGSDLASLRTEAVADGDHFVVTGQKIWTTFAQEVTHLYVLVRTDRTVKKQAGISFLLVDMATPGITVRPIMNLAGDDKFCEVFFDAVRVPRANLVGAPNEGWTVAKTQLGFERLFLGSPKQPQYALDRLEDLARRCGAFADPVFADKFTRLTFDVADLAALYLRYVAIVRRGEKLPPSVSALKILATETYARIADLIVETAGGAGALEGEPDVAGEPTRVLTHFYYARPATIYGGSNEIQRNILAKQVLNLPS